MPLRLAYLNTRYPSLSHTFIEREVAAVRASGVEVHTFSIRRPGPADLLSPAHQQAARTTCYILDGVLGLLAAQFRAILNHPWAWLRTMFAAQRLSPPGLRARLLQLAYATEAVKLARELRHRGLSHVHVHMANNGAMVALLGCIFDRSLSYSLTIHGSAEFFNVEAGRLKPKVEGAQFIRVISSFCKAQVMAWTDPAAWPHFHVVHCGVDLAAFAPRNPLPPGPLRLLTVGRVVAIKGYALLLEACRQLADQGIDWRLDMVGEGPLLPALRTLAHDLGIADRITFSGPVGQGDIPAHFDAADVMVVSSFMEGVPVVLMEAMAKQLAVVSTQVAGVPELVDASCGRLVTVGSADELAAALAALAADRARLGRMGVAGRKRVAEEFTIQEAGRQMASLFARYVPGPQPQPHAVPADEEEPEAELLT